VVFQRFNFIWSLLLTAPVFALSATVETNSGTIVIFGFSKDKIVVAADSRGKKDAGNYSDDECKIIALTDKFAYAANGMTGLRDEGVVVPYRPIEMEANEEARLAFNSVPPGSDHFLRRVAVLWGENVTRIFRQALKAGGPTALGKDDPIVLNGYFFGVSPSGGLGLYMEKVYHNGEDVSFDSEPEAIVLTDILQYALQGKTDLAKKETDRWERQSAALPVNEDLDVLKVILWVQLTLDAHPDSNEIGGPIDSLTVTAPRGVIWHKRKQECAAQDLKVQQLPAQ
jgi:hypothetical protein